MVKLLRSEVLELIAMAGIDPGSAGLAKARKAGITVHENGIEGLLKMSPRPELVFDATSAGSHLAHAPRLSEAGIMAIDLTPAAVGDYVVPTVNIDERVSLKNAEYQGLSGGARGIRTPRCR